MYLEANIFANNYCHGNSFILANEFSYTTDNISTMDNLKLFDSNYQNIINTLMKNRDLRCETVDDLLNAYLAILLDPSFKQNIEVYINRGLSVSEALMAFYENMIINILPPRISKEIFGLIRMLNIQPSEHVIDMTTKSIIVANEITLENWLQLDIKSIAGIVLLNSSTQSHSSIIAKSLKIPLALISNNVVPLSNFEDKFIVLCNNSVRYFPIPISKKQLPGS